MDVRPGPADWKTPGMIRAEQRLAKAAEDVDVAIAKARAVKRTKPKPLTDEEVQKLDELSREKDAPKGLQELAKLVDSGRYSWRDVFDARSLDDPKVRAALKETSKDFVDDKGLLKAINDAKVAGYTMEEIQRAMRAGRFSTRGILSGRPKRQPDDEDDFGDGSIMRESW